MTERRIFTCQLLQVNCLEVFRYGNCKVAEEEVDNNFRRRPHLRQRWIGDLPGNSGDRVDVVVGKRDGVTNTLLLPTVTPRAELPTVTVKGPCT